MGDHVVDPLTLEPISLLNFRHRTDRVLQLRFLEEETPTTAGSIEMVAKAIRDYNGDVIVSCDAFILNGTVESGYYEGYPSFNVEYLNDLFNTGNLQYFDLEMEFVWLNAGHTGAAAVKARVWNSYLKEDDGGVIPPVGQTGLSVVTGVLNGPGLGITTVTGGGGSDLDAMTTVGISNRIMIIPDVDGVGYTIWYLRGGTEADSPGNGIVRPLDYATTTNEKVWVGIL